MHQNITPLTGNKEKFIDSFHRFQGHAIISDNVALVAVDAKVPVLEDAAMNHAPMLHFAGAHPDLRDDDTPIHADLVASQPIDRLFAADHIAIEEFGDIGGHARYFAYAIFGTIFDVNFLKDQEYFLRRRNFRNRPNVVVRIGQQERPCHPAG